MYQQSFIYKFLLAPQFRGWRYLTLILFFTIVSLNQAFVGYMELIPQIGTNIYWIIALTIAVYVVSLFLLNKYIFQLLLKGKYLLFAAGIVLCAVLFTAVANITYSTYIEDYDLFSEVTIIDNLSAFVIYILCVLGITIPVYLRNWMVGNQQLRELKIKQASSQVEQFKEQISPDLFFRVLRKSKSLVYTEPDKTSAMLMKLGQLLRYQLYDCNREEVLLTAEISFLQNFLMLEKLTYPSFDYTIETEGNLNGIFVAPSVLLPYVRSVAQSFTDKNEGRSLAVQLSNTDDHICITLRVTGGIHSASLEKEQLKVRERLDTLYQGDYELISADTQADGTLRMELWLNKR